MDGAMQLQTYHKWMNYWPVLMVDTDCNFLEHGTGTSPRQHWKALISLKKYKYPKEGKWKTMMERKPGD